MIYAQRTESLHWERFGFTLGRIPKPKPRWLKKLPNGIDVYEWTFS